MAPMTILAADPIADLWRQARTWLADRTYFILGAADIAHTLASKARRAIARRLARLEALVLKLLLIEAARHPGRTAGLSPGRSRSFASAKPGQARVATSAARCALGGARSNLARAEDSNNPETWRVRFNLRIPRDRAPHLPPRDTGGPRIRDLGRPLLVRDIWKDQAKRALLARLRPEPDVAAAHARTLAKSRKLARRFEAVRRVIADPRRFIAALARKLKALGKRARAFARRIATAAPPRGSGRALGNAVGYALYAAYDLPGDDTS